jgi:hypothetical protein
MAKNVSIALVLIAVLLSASSKKADAQVGPNCIGFVGYSCLPGPNGCAPLPLPPAAFDCQLFEFEGVTCKIMTPGCTPAAAPSEGCPT